MQGSRWKLGKAVPRLGERGAERNPALDVMAAAAPDDPQMAPDGLEWL